jgi:hypothetical protein
MVKAHKTRRQYVMGSTVDVGTDNVIKLYVVHFKKSETYKKCYVYVLLLK